MQCRSQLPFSLNEPEGDHVVDHFPGDEGDHDHHQLPPAGGHLLPADRQRSSEYCASSYMFPTGENDLDVEEQGSFSHYHARVRRLMEDDRTPTLTYADPFPEPLSMRIFGVEDML